MPPPATATRSERHLLEQAEIAYQADDVPRYRTLANRLVTHRPDHARGLELLLFSAIARRDGSELLAILGHCQAFGGVAMLRLRTVLHALLNRPDHAALRFVHDAIPPNHAGWIVAKYYRGCVDIAQRDYQAALEHFAAFRRALPAFNDLVPFFDDAVFNILFRQGTVVAGPSTVAERLAAPIEPSALPPPLTLVQRASGTSDSTASPHTGVVFFASCNGLYFDRFATPFLAAFARLPQSHPVHLHVCDPTPDSRRAMSDLAACGVGLSTEPPGRYDTCTYFACSRFFVAPSLMDLYRTALVSVDMDCAITPAVERALEAGRDADFGCFHTGRNEPASVFQASLMYFADTPDGRRFVDGLQKFCLPRLDQRDFFNWMLDQAALISVRTHFEAIGTPLRFVEFDQTTGLQLSDVCENLTTEDEMQDLKYRVWSDHKTRAPSFTWQPD